MDDAERWVALAAAVLGEPDPDIAEALLVAGLQGWGHAYLTVRTDTAPVVVPDDVHLYPAPDWERSPQWREAVDEAALEHPLYAYNLRTGTHLPATLALALARGHPLTERVVALMEDLGFTRHQMTIPLGVNRHGLRDAYALVSDVPFTDDDLDRAAWVQALVAGLDAHVRQLRQVRAAARHAPDPAVVRLTPRELLVLHHIARGTTVEGIASRLGISPRTVHKHQEHLYRKLGAVDRLSAVLSAQRRGLLRSPDR